MSKQSTNIARICASLILGFTQVSFAATAEPTLLDIPPPPILRGPPAGGQPQENTTTYNTGNNAAAAAVGTNKNSVALNNSPNTPGAQMSNSGQGLFAKANANAVSATSTQSDNANAVNAATQEAARKAAAAVSTPTGVMWVNQVFPAANTMYSSPQRK